MVPQVHVPLAVQVSPPGAQSTQADPLSPHAVGDATAQVVAFTQQPAQEPAVHTQEPFEQTSPCPQGDPWPHAHVPPAQLSAVMPHASHVLPSVPHVDDDGDTHASLAQHPVGHDCALQTHCPRMQTCPEMHGCPVPQLQLPDCEQLSALVRLQPEHASPPVPHAVSVGDTQLAPLQHPFGQFVAVHPVHTPLVHTW